MNNFKRNYLENYNDSEHAVKTKNAPFFMNFTNFYKNWQLFSHWTGPLSSLRYDQGKVVDKIFSDDTDLSDLINTTPGVCVKFIKEGIYF